MLGCCYVTATVLHTESPPSNDTGMWPRQPAQARLNVFKQPTRLLSVRQLLEVLDLCCSDSHKVRIANFGAGEYRPAGNVSYTLDPVNEILMHSKQGHALLVDPDSDRLQRASQQLPMERVVALAEFATPETVHRQLRKARLLNITVLKIDIDCFDCSLLSAVLDKSNGRLRPAVIVMEANVKFPPPIRFNVGFVPGIALGSRIGKPWGCSLAYQAAFLGARHYSLLHLDILDSVFVRDDLWRFPWRPLHPQEAFEAHFLNFVGTSNFRPPMWERAHALLADAKGSSARLLARARLEPLSQDSNIRRHGQQPAPWNMTVDEWA
eukprot:CAMPEP_0185458886 /NCGR_PEP_ID=MMETSP1365-20130426/83487_1 /TAXON_ID=38817 /ORGANISM="Gephyrocapsa oceanica, Strain RCC1303" /LENGTH=322 /DNA_ID=CAMNT_0028065403 /DNA_START=87 /DNA_END=1052 /DNA_ORIENTATION=-